MSDQERGDAIAERDRILIAMDQEAAKAFIVKHGGKAPKNLNYELVLHMARHEVTTMPAELHMQSKIFLARSGHYGLISEAQNGRYANVVLNLIFPKTMTDEYIRSMAVPA